MAYSTIEGKWKDFDIRQLRPLDALLVSEHVKNYYLEEEDILKMAGKTLQKRRDYDQIVSSTLADELSFGAFHVETGKIAGICLANRRRKGQNDWPFELKSKEVKTRSEFLKGLNEKYNLFELYGIEEYAELQILSVDLGFLNQGLGTELAKRGLTFLKAQGFPVVKSVVTCPFARILHTKLEFVELGKIYFRDLKNIKGKFLCSSATDEEYAALMVVKF